MNWMEDTMKNMKQRLMENEDWMEEIIIMKNTRKNKKYTINEGISILEEDMR